MFIRPLVYLWEVSAPTPTRLHHNMGLLTTCTPCNNTRYHNAHLMHCQCLGNIYFWQHKCFLVFFSHKFVWVLRVSFGHLSDDQYLSKLAPENTNLQICSSQEDLKRPNKRSDKKPKLGCKWFLGTETFFTAIILGSGGLPHVASPSVSRGCSSVASDPNPPM